MWLEFVKKVFQDLTKFLNLKTVKKWRENLKVFAIKGVKS